MIKGKPKQKKQHFIQKVSTNQIDIHINLTSKKTKQKNKKLKANEFKTKTLKTEEEKINVFRFLLFKLFSPIVEIERRRKADYSTLNVRFEHTPT